MSQLINIYCDESCHLESRNLNSENRFMVLGGVSCPESRKKDIFNRIKEIKNDNNLNRFSEMKWTKITVQKLSAYKALIRYFFDCTDLSFRAVVIDKMQLQHARFNQSHDHFYYKMYWNVLEWFIEPSNAYCIYLDMKDTQGYNKVKNLHNVLCNSHHDFNREVIKSIQEVRSHEIAVMQLTDLLIGAISYVNRYSNDGTSTAKQEIVDLIRHCSSVSLTRSTSLGARKFNVFHWRGQDETA